VAELDHLAGLDELRRFITAAAVWRFIEPRSSLGPHFDGQRWLGSGGDQVGA